MNRQLLMLTDMPTAQVNTHFSKIYKFKLFNISKMLLPTVLVLAAAFPKFVKNSNFQLNFHQKLSQKFPNNLYVSSKRAKN